MKSVLIIFIGAVLFVACKKEESVFVSVSDPFVGVYDTIHPLSYLPAYPGSNWVYINQNNDTSVKSCNPEYVLDSYALNPFMGSTQMSDTVYVPRYDGMLMYGYDRRVGVSLHSDRRFWKLLSDDPLWVGHAWEVKRFHNYIYLKRKLESIDTTVVVNGVVYYPCVVIKEYVIPSYTLDDWSRSIYANDVGLVRKEVFNSDDSLVDFIDLIDYSINK